MDGLELVAQVASTRVDLWPETWVLLGGKLLPVCLSSAVSPRRRRPVWSARHGQEAGVQTGKESLAGIPKWVPSPHKYEGLAEPNVCSKCGSHRAVASSWEPGLSPRRGAPVTSPVTLGAMSLTSFPVCPHLCHHY